MRCMTCLSVVDGTSGWIRNPNGAVCCWPCYEAGKMPLFPVDPYADEEPQQAAKPPRESKPRLRAADAMESSIVEGW